MRIYQNKINLKMKKGIKSEYIEKIDKIFQLKSTQEAHQEVIPILKQMAHEPKILYELLSELLYSDNFFINTRTSPVISLTLEVGLNYRIKVHCFLPLPDRASNISHNWIHHHNDRSLSTVNIFGDNGYNSIWFKDLYRYDSSSNCVKMSIEKECSHKLYNVEYIPPFVPHVLFIPPSLTITYALWSSESKIQNVRLYSKIRRGIEKPIKNLANKIHATKLLNLLINKNDNSRQFAPNVDHFVCVRNKLYSPSTNNNYIQNIFYILQEVGFKDEETLSILRAKSIIRGRVDIVKLIDRYLINSKIDDIYDSNHLSTLGINFTRESILEAVDS